MVGGGGQSGFNADDFVLDPNVKRHIQLDMLRVIAIYGVVVDHGNPVSKQYGIHDVMFTQNWTLQLLWVTCGISWSLTRSSLGPYVMRLCVYLAIGVSFNWMAWVYQGMPWRHDLQGVVYQFAFIVGLIVYVSFTAWLKPSLQQIYASRIEAAGAGDKNAGETELAPNGTTRKSNQKGLMEETNSPRGGERTPTVGDNLNELDAEERSAAKMFGLVVVALVLGMVGLSLVLSLLETQMVKGIINLILGHSAEFWTRDLDDRAFFGQFIGTFGAYLLIVVGARLLRSPRQAPWLTWVVIAYIYSCRVLFLPLLFNNFGGGIGRFFVGLELFLIGLVANTAGLKHAAALKGWFADYFIVVVVFVALLWGPAWENRMDEHPPSDLMIIFRVQLCELVFLVAFLAAGSLMFPEEGWSQRTRSWLAETATMLFLVHKATHLAVPVPYNWYIVFILVPGLFWFRHFVVGKRAPDRRTAVAVLPTTNGAGTQ